MLQGIEFTAQGMTAMSAKQNQISNNLANINTTGYKRSGMFLRAYSRFVKNDQMEPFVNREIKADEVYTDFSEGPAKKTGGKLDMMIEGSGFFTVMTPYGTRYTRDGSFSLDSNGYMVTTDGSKVMGKEGFIQLEDTKGVNITGSGEVIQDGDTQGELLIADFRKPYKLLREKNGYFKPEIRDNPVVESPGFKIRQGFLEKSNVNPIKGMSEMISSYRNYEAQAKAMRAQDETLDKSVNSVGRLQ